MKYKMDHAEPIKEFISLQMTSYIYLLLRNSEYLLFTRHAKHVPGEFKVDEEAFNTFIAHISYPTLFYAILGSQVVPPQNSRPFLPSYRDDP